MYEDDLSDILPKLPTRSAALPSFGDEHDDPFKNPFNSSVDPWSTYGQSSSGAFDDWNTNAFADEPSRGQMTTQQEEASASLETGQDAEEEEFHYPGAEEAVAENESAPKLSATAPDTNAPADTTPTAEKSTPFDPLGGELANVEEEPEHVPVFKRKLPLVMGERRSSIVGSPTVEKKEEVAAPVPQEKENAETIKEERANEEVSATPTQEPHTEEHATTPTLPAVESALPAEEMKSLSSDHVEITQSTPDIPTVSSSATSLSDKQTPPHESSREPSMSDIEGKSALDKVAISPLERTPNMMPNPLDRNYSAPSGFAEAGGWGDAWGANNGSGYNAGFGEVVERKDETEVPAVLVEEQETSRPSEDEDPEDNVPLAQSLSKLPTPVHMYQITVGDPQKVGDPISAHIIYTVHTKTTNPNYKKSQFSVLRRYSDFVWLYDTLCANNPGVIVPPIPEKNSLGRFQEAFVQARRIALNKCLSKMANHPGLCNDKDLQLFLESDNFSLDIKHRRAEEGGGLLSAFSTSIASTKFYETDDWFETKRVYLDGLESQLKGLVRSMEAVAKQRAEFSTSLQELAEALESLATCDISKQLAATFAQLGSLQRKAKELQDEQAQQDMVTFVGTVEEYGRMIGSVRLAFASRVKCFGQWQTAENEVRRVKANHEKAKKQSKTPERLHYHMQEVADSERKAVHTKSEFERVTKLLKIELHRFDMERVEDFKRSLEAFLEGMIGRQKELVRTWEEYQATLLQRAEVNPTANGSDGNAETSTITSTA